RELPGALVLVFDTDLRFILTAGQPLQRLGNPTAFGEGRLLADAFPSDLWRSIGPLFGSALAGETRSREVWTVEEHCLMIDVGPLRVDHRGAAEHAGKIAGGVAVLIDGTARRTADLFDA